MRDSSKLSTSQTTPHSRGVGSRVSRSRRAASTRANQVCLKELDPCARILVGNAGDHPLVLQLLAQAYQCPLAEDFQGRLDEPSYEPSDRLLVECKDQLIGHVRVSKQIGWFHRQRYPLAILQDFFTLPEFEVAQYDETLLEVAETVAAREGSLLGLVRTKRPQWFRQHGWSCCHGQGYTRANTRAILSHLDPKIVSRKRRRCPIEIRSWRHVELESLRNIYGQISPKMWGALHRSEETWHWLAGRKAQDQILIAVKKSRDASKKRATEPNVVGYAIVRDACIVEMMVLDGYASVRPMLVARACRDAIDRDHHFVSLHTPPDDPMHELLVTAGGNWINDVAALEGKWMLKLLAPERWFERLYPLLQQRAEAGGITKPWKINVQCGDIRQRLMLTRRSSRLEKCNDHSESPDVQCDRLTFQDLLTSNLVFSQALEQGRIKVGCDSALQAIAALFPTELLWQSPFPLLRL